VTLYYGFRVQRWTPSYIRRGSFEHMALKRNVTISIPISPETKTVLDRIASEEKLMVSELSCILLEEA
jgi:hypothetical protein